MKETGKESVLDLYQWEALLAHETLYQAAKETAAYKKAARTERDTDAPAYRLLSWPDTLRAIGKKLYDGAARIERSRQVSYDGYNKAARALIDAATKPADDEPDPTMNPIRR